MNPDEVSLLRAICEAPDDDAPRLVFADWLDDTSDAARVARAEFIRLQIRLEQVPADDPRRAVFEQRAWQLLHDHNPAWLAPMGMKLWGVRYRRGFLELATTRSDLILANPEWFALQPIVELAVELDRACWELVLGALRRLEGIESNQGLAAAWRNACTSDPRSTLLAAGGDAVALAGHPLVRRARVCRMGVALGLFSSRFGHLPWALIPRNGG